MGWVVSPHRSRWLPEIRRETVTLVKQAIEGKRRAYVLVNNRSEGNAPMTVQAIKYHL